MDRVWSSNECVCCACDPSVCLDSPSICLFVFLYVGSYLLMLFLYELLHTMWSGKRLQLLCILPFDILCLSTISMMSVTILLAVCMLVGMVV